MFNSLIIKKMKKTIIFVKVMLLIAAYGFSQGTAINDNGALPDSSAILDVSSTSQGLLIPRITAAQKNAIPRPAQSLLIYQIDGAQPGYYFNAGTKTAAAWVYMGSDDLGNHTATDSVNMSNKKIYNLATCTNNLDAANKLYVDSKVAAGGGGGHYLGESYQGGKIFWIDGAGTHGLIAYSKDYSNIPYSYVTAGIGVSAQNNNDGQMNSAQILKQPGHTTGAAHVCDTISVTDGGNTYDDWYLPASYEMYILFQNQQYVGNFNPMTYYWSSTESHWNQDRALYIQFDATSGSDYWLNAMPKNYVYDWIRFRCIRKF